MKQEKLLSAIGEIDDNLIISATAAPAKTKMPVWVKMGTAAACLGLLIAGLTLLNPLFSPTEDPSETKGVLLTDNGVVLPPANFSLAPPNKDHAGDMIAFFIYEGSQYQAYEWVQHTDIVGDYVGTSTGLINEWTQKDGYVDFAGSVKGPIYTVKGYDPTFMLCMQHSDDQVLTYICNTGFTIKNGSELFEDRIYLSEHYRSVTYETRESWYYSKHEISSLSDADQTVEAFIEQLNTAEFLPWKTIVENEGKTTSSIYDTEICHLYFHLENGLKIHLRLYENGYVRFAGMMDIGLQVDGEVFNELLSKLN